MMYVLIVLALKKTHEIDSPYSLSLLISWLNIADAAEVSQGGPNWWWSHSGNMPGPLSPILEKSYPCKISPIGLYVSKKDELSD